MIAIKMYTVYNVYVYKCKPIYALLFSQQVSTTQAVLKRFVSSHSDRGHLIWRVTEYTVTPVLHPGDGRAQTQSPLQFTAFP